VYQATITRDQDGADLESVFAAEHKSFPNNRATYAVEQTDDGLRINVEANDTKALKAVNNSITTILDIYDKSERL